MQVGDPIADINEEMGKNHPIAKLIGDFTTAAADYYFNGPGGAEIAIGTGTGFIKQRQIKNTANALKYVPTQYKGIVAGAFKTEIVAKELEEELIVYRHWGGTSKESGHWLSEDAYTDPEEARKLLALPTDNTAANITIFKIPAGTTILRGEAASQDCIPE